VCRMKSHGLANSCPESLLALSSCSQEAPRRGEAFHRTFVSEVEMNAATVIPLSLPQKAGSGSSAKRAATNPVCVRFGAFELDEANARLSRDGIAITLAPRPFGLLCALARRPGSLLTKNELLDDVWGHQFVSESVLKTAISDLRTV